MYLLTQDITLGVIGKHRSQLLFGMLALLRRVKNCLRHTSPFIIVEVSLI